MKDDMILLITGASSDIAGAFLKCAAGGYGKILAHYCHSAERIKELRREYGEKIIPLQADFSKPDDAARMIGEIQDMDASPDHILHIAAPKLQINHFRKENIEAFERQYDETILPIIQILKAFLPNMAKQKYGKVVFLLSANTVGMPEKFQSAYTTSKYAMLGLMKSLAMEYAEKGITMNGVSPDMVETRFLKDIPQLVIDKGAEKNALHRNLKAEEVAPVIDFLFSEGADQVNGVNVPVGI